MQLLGWPHSGCLLAGIFLSFPTCSVQSPTSLQDLKDLISKGISGVDELIHGHIISTVPTGYTAESYYPAPRGGWVAEWADSYAKAQLVVEKMTLAEKVNLTTGTGVYMGRCTGNTGSALRFGIPSLCLEDSALGVASTQNNTAFPAGITIGATFNKDLMFARGQALGQEARGKGVDILLGPMVGPLGRKPRGGRNWEGFGADPVLQAIGGSQTIRGIQSEGVIATIKHFIGNEQEEYRQDIFPHGLMRALSSNIDDRTLHELYAWPFAEAIRAGVGAVMMSYNELNGSACSQNSMLINNILKDELGFQGFVMSDWYGQIGGVSSALAGLDMAMPGDGNTPLLGLAYWAYELSTSILNGTVPVDRLNDMVTRIVATWYQMGQDKDYPPPNFSSNTADKTGPCYPGSLLEDLTDKCLLNENVNVQGNHSAIAREVAREAITMVKNVDNTLPLSKEATLKIFGSDAQVNPDGPNDCSLKTCNKGTLGMGWGAGSANYPYLDDPISAIKRITPNVFYSSSDTFPSGLTANASDIAIVFISSDSGENGYIVEGNNGDRSSSGLVSWHNGDALVKAAASTYSTVIVVIHTVGPIILEPWINLATVKSVLFAHLPGQEAGSSLTDILFGDYSPSGHLPYTIPISESDYPTSLNLVGFTLGQVQDTFSEGLYIDYRYLNKHSITPRYPFGHGLSYTTFTYTNPILTPITPLTSTPPARPAKGSTPVYNTTIPDPAEVAFPENFEKINRYLYPYLKDPTSITSNTPYSDYPPGYTTTPHTPPPSGGALGGNPALYDAIFNLNITITNTGTRPGKAVAMLFVQFPNSTQNTYDTPIIQLRDFAKTPILEGGGTVDLVLGVTRKDLSVWDVGSQDWVVPGGGEGGLVLWVGGGSEGLGVGCETGGAGCFTSGRTPPV